MTRLPAVSVVLLLSGCSLVEPDLQVVACRTDSDCFVGQGEYCDRTTVTSAGAGECRPRRDAATPDKGPGHDRPRAADLAAVDRPTSPVDGLRETAVPDRQQADR